ncbi:MULTISPECIES: hypothetical protein [Acinetobacter]|jgi:hypothetical protein|uniref:hypothetical protein n=1 Tax=Acinetobacter TaxID=469 RepID=UPI00044A119E|nr:MULTISPECIES: hypothetical protein [Acinetobacter]EXF55847.1 hypothetical protein J502_3047 [Acinetobacter sp. 1294596]MCK4094351.1 hypothetical protein [Acinetobacter radioresistens]MCU4568169.1 hypothetical protein [Acinetobacter radioresistens]MCX0347123.1 hypothetical protein [Acinetobacter radioresistens]
MSIAIPKLTITSQRLVLDNEKLRRANAKVTTATAYKYGDLLVLSDDNVLTHAADESSWDVICGQNVTAAEATIKAADGIEIPVYYGGVFNVEAVSLNGALLDKAKYDAARAKATKNKIELSKV